MNETQILVDEYEYVDEISCITKIFESEKRKSIKLFGLLTAVSLPALGVRDIVLWSSKSAKMVKLSLVFLISFKFAKFIEICKIVYQ